MNIFYFSQALTKADDCITLLCAIRDVPVSRCTEIVKSGKLHVKRIKYNQDGTHSIWIEEEKVAMLNVVNTSEVDFEFDAHSVTEELPIYMEYFFNFPHPTAQDFHALVDYGDHLQAFRSFLEVFYLFHRQWLAEYSIILQNHK